MGSNVCGNSGCSSQYLDYCFQQFGTSCCSVCSENIISAVEFLDDYLYNSKLTFYKKNVVTNEIMMIPVNINYNIDRGILNNNSISLTRLFTDPTVLVEVNGGINYCTNVNFTNSLLKLNLFKELSNKIDFIATLVSVYSIVNNEKNFNIIIKYMNNILKVNIENFNYINEDYYRESYINKNKDAIYIVKICTQISFIWGCIYTLAKQYNITLNLLFKIACWEAILYNLDGTKVITAEGLNIYLNKYKNEFIPLNYNTYFEYWNNIYNRDDDIINNLLYARSTDIFNVETLTIEQIFQYFNRDLCKINFEDCLSYIAIVRSNNFQNNSKNDYQNNDVCEQTNKCNCFNNDVCEQTNKCTCSNIESIQYNDHLVLLEELKKF